MKETSVTNPQEAKAVYTGLQVTGNPDLFTVLSKASTSGWMKSTKAMEVPEVGVVVQVSTQINNIDGTHSIAEALTFVPGAHIVPDESGSGKKLVRDLSTSSPYFN